MGQASSSVSHDTPISISPDLIDSLANQLADPHTSPERQSALDQSVRDSIQAQLDTLRRSEAEIRLQLAAALEKENLDREKAADGSVNSHLVLGDIDDLRSKIDKYKERKSLSHLPQVKTDAEELTKCFQTNPDTILNCWEQVNKFKTSSKRAQQDYIKSLPS
ncbi:hypothetical protein DL96DRAFT_1599254 [Flagelloscypha sp. PMI_526]|nr:hypothetical protein DL96DRAFT_1599254 [Flagelloscypha sp. PMI_526]